MTVTAATSIRDVHIARIVAINPTTLAGVRFTQYPLAGNTDYDEIVVPNHRCFDIDIDESTEVFADNTSSSNGAEVEMQTRFAVTVLYKATADTASLAQMVREDILLVRNALRTEVVDQYSIVPDDGLPAPTRTAKVWAFTIRGHAQHAEAEWSAT